MCSRKIEKIPSIRFLVVKEAFSKQVNIQSKEMKPLQSGRTAFVWMGVHFVDNDPIKWQQKLVHKLFSTTFEIVLIVSATLHVISLLNVKLSSPEEFFFVLLQFVMMVHGFSAFITIYSRSSRISTVFQSLTEIYEKCN